MRRAFTLIELLVVIAIIAILAAILFPVFASAKNAAKGAACLSHMKQLGAANALYLGDHDDVWFGLIQVEPLPGFADQRPWVGYDNHNAGDAGPVQGRVDLPAQNPPRPGAVDPYLKNDAIKRCPNAPAGTQTAWAFNYWNPETDSAYYAAHPEARGREWGPASRTVRMAGGLIEYLGTSDSEVSRPAETLLAWEHKAIAPICVFLMPYDWTTSAPNLQELKDHFNFLHTAGTNSLWGDGHAKRVVYGQLKREWFVAEKS